MKNSKKTLFARRMLLFVCLVTLSSTALSQWTAQTSGTTNQLNSISFLDVSNGICVGNQVILKTPNGGSTWGVTNNATNLKSVHYVASSLAFCTGEDKVYKWDGSTWAQVGGSLGAAVETYVVYFPSSLTGYILGESLGAGKLFKTTNGGNNWAVQYTFAGAFYGMKFLDANTGFVCGNSKRVMKTTDGGATFSFILNLGGSESFRAIDIVANRGFVAGDEGVRYSTTDNGSTWNPISGSTFNYYKSAAIWTNGTSVVWEAVGIAAPYLLINASNNYGANWSSQAPTLVSGTYNSVCNGQNSWTFYACGNGGIIYKTTNAGGNFVGVQSISETAENFSLSQNYPNPFNPSTTIEFSIPSAGDVQIVLFDMLGKEIDMIVNSGFNSGTYKVNYDASHLSSGTYFYKIYTKEFVDVKKMLLVK